MDYFDTRFGSIDSGLVGPWRKPAQMLADQSYNDHMSIHDEATAAKLGFSGAPIEGPTHFSQFEPFGVAEFGDAWFRHGCASLHFRNPVFAGEEVRAEMSRPEGDATRIVRLEKSDGQEVLTGTISLSNDGARTALDERLAEIRPLEEPVVLKNIRIGMTSQRHRVRMDFDTHMGDLYPFSLADKLETITEPSPVFNSGKASPFGAPVIPMEMISVLVWHKPHGFPIPEEAVGLFSDQEIALLEGPLFVGRDYEVQHEVVALSGSRRTESLWIETSVYEPGETRRIARLLINVALLKDSVAA